MNGGMVPDPASLGILPGTTINVDPSSAWPIAGSTGQALGTGTGQYGIVPQAGGSLPMGNWLNQFWTWLNQPFTTVLSFWGMFKLIGAIIIGIIAWNLILYHVRIAAESV